MPRSPEETELHLSGAIAPGFRRHMLSQGQAQSMVRRDGELPAEAPQFSELLDYDLLNYGYSLLNTGLRLISEGNENSVARASFAEASQAIEAAIKNVGDGIAVEFHRLMAGAASHLGGYSARAFSLVRSRGTVAERDEAAATLADLLLRDFSGIERRIREFSASGVSSDEAILSLLERADDDVVVEAETEAIANDFDPVQLTLLDNYLAATADCMLGLEQGNTDLFAEGVQNLDAGKEACSELALSSLWWIHRLSRQILGDLATTSIRSNIPETVQGSEDAEWSELREMFIESLYRRERAEVDLWPSQLGSVEKVFGDRDDLVVSLPTSAGKTRLAELCILNCLGTGKRVVYVTPLRALSAQTERVLERTFRPLGKTVSSLYGSIGTSEIDGDVLRERDIVVATPEKLDFALRSDPSILDDVGLIVLDEGHMIGAEEREVRYEAQIQRLLRRDDAEDRRIVCLSAVLPTGDELSDFVDWLTTDEPSGLIRETWRPTQLRFGVLPWRGGQARLEITVGEERPFIPRFVEAQAPPQGQRTNSFPNDQRELVLSTAWKFVDEGQTVMIFCPERRGVEPYARAVVKLNRQGLLPALIDADSPELAAALSVGAEWFGEDHAVLAALRLGVAIHHGALPTPYRREIERLLRDETIKVTVASPTLAQGLNLSASTILFHGIRRGRNLVRASEFRNVIGRAGRAYVDTEGLVIYPTFAPTWRTRQGWNQLTTDDAGKELESGLVAVTMNLLRRIVRHLNGDALEPALNYLTGASPWTLPLLEGESAEDLEQNRTAWMSSLEKLDVAILSSIGDLDADESDVEELLGQALVDSLWERQLLRLDADLQTGLRRVLVQRGQDIWESSSAPQRRGWYLAGLGMNAGQHLDAIADEVARDLGAADAAIAAGEFGSATEHIVSTAEVIFSHPTFEPIDDLPENWRGILRAWVNGAPLADLADGTMTTAKFVETELLFRLTWGVEAVRVRQASQLDAPDTQMTGASVSAIETGTFDASAAVLMRSGFDFRSAAIKAVEETHAVFTDAYGLRQWLRGLHQDLLESPEWPTPESRHVWERFVASRHADRPGAWEHQTFLLDDVIWIDGEPELGRPLRISSSVGGELTVLSPSFEVLGTAHSNINPDLDGILRAERTEEGLRLDYRGPGDFLV